MARVKGTFAVTFYPTFSRLHHSFSYLSQRSVSMSSHFFPAAELLPSLLYYSSFPPSHAVNPIVWFFLFSCICNPIASSLCLSLGCCLHGHLESPSPLPHHDCRGNTCHVIRLWPSRKDAVGLAGWASELPLSPVAAPS